MDSSVQAPLVVAAVVFLAFTLWRARPLTRGPAPRENRDARAALDDAERRIANATDERARALALCDAGDACARAVGRAKAAAAYYQRALRTDPSSTAIVERVVLALRSRPRQLEALLWRRLASEAWTGPNRAATALVLASLARAYEGPLHNGLRARAFTRATTALSEPSA
jgi:hypothetical protein